MRKKKTIKVIFIISAIFLILLAWYKNLFWTYETTEISEYGKYRGVLDYEPALLPSELSSDIEVIQYRYIVKSGLLSDSQYIQLICKYDEGTYSKEKDRLTSIKDEYSTVIYNTELFKMPAYVYMYGGDNSEYALVDDDEKTIYYLYIKDAFEFENQNMYLQ